MMYPGPPEDDRHHAQADEVALSDGVPVQRIHEIQFQIKTNHMREEQYLGSVIRKLRLLMGSGKTRESKKS